MIMNGTLIVIDIIWCSTVGAVWGKYIKDNSTWNSLHGIHSFEIGRAHV